VRNRGEAVALVGLDPETKESGNTKKAAQISKKGDKRLRGLLYMGALSAIASGKGVLREFYDRLVKKGKPKKVAVTACARKLLLFAFAKYKKAMEELQLQMA
ncbi:transposase, partial [Thermodesulfatator atlanticus]|uniref:transposase n=4 Tax=Thermodesulfatator atlanticus TaxID=501497 RepID=UPI0012F8CA3E